MMLFQPAKSLILTSLLLAVAWSYPVDNDDTATQQIHHRITRTNQKLQWLEENVVGLSNLLSIYHSYLDTADHKSSEVLDSTLPKPESLDRAENKRRPSRQNDNSEHSNVRRTEPLPGVVEDQNNIIGKTLMNNEHEEPNHQLWASQTLHELKRDSISEQSKSGGNYTFIPPPNTHVTPALLGQSLTFQPENTGTISSVIPYFEDGIISFHVQLHGFVAASLVLNGSTSLPCDTIGSQPGPGLIVVPRSVKNGTTIVSLPDCLVIAVNVYNPTVITYWVQKPDGSIFSVAGDNKIHNLDKISTNGRTSVSLRAVADINSKRDDIEHPSATYPEHAIVRNQILPSDCQADCPHSNMVMLPSNTTVCGCISDTSAHNIKARGISAPNWHNAVMTPDACAGMTCLTNGGLPAMYNPFSRTCWCTDPVYVDVDFSGLA